MKASGAQMTADRGMVSASQHFLLAPIPPGVSPVAAASICIPTLCGITALQSLVPHIQPGFGVFINGGSGKRPNVNRRRSVSWICSKHARDENLARLSSEAAGSARSISMLMADINSSRFDYNWKIGCKRARCSLRLTGEFAFEDAPASSGVREI